MAVIRETPKCPFCGKIIAKAIYRKYESWQAPVYGDDFERWEYIKHNCKKAPKPNKKTKKIIQDLINKLNQQ